MVSFSGRNENPKPTLLDHRELSICGFTFGHDIIFRKITVKWWLSQPRSIVEVVIFVYMEKPRVQTAFQHVNKTPLYDRLFDGLVWKIGCFWRWWFILVRFRENSVDARWGFLEYKLSFCVTRESYCTSKGQKFKTIIKNVPHLAWDGSWKI